MVKKLKNNNLIIFKSFNLLILLLFIITNLNGQSKYRLFIKPPEEKDFATDSLTLYFNIENPDNKYDKITSTSSTYNFKVTEIYKGHKIIHPPEFVKNSMHIAAKDSIFISSDIKLSLLVDISSSMSEQSINSIKQAVISFVKKSGLPDSTVFLSTFSNDISQSYLLTKANVDNITNNLLSSSNSSRESERTQSSALFNAIYSKLLEFSNPLLIKIFEPDYKQNQEFINRNKSRKFLIILTSGVNDVEKIDRYINGKADIIESKTILDQIVRLRNTGMKIFCLHFSEQQTTNSPRESGELLKSFCTENQNTDGYAQTSVLSPQTSYLNSYFNKIFREKMGYLFSIRLRIPCKEYVGYADTLFMSMTDSKSPVKANGKIWFCFGYPLSPFKPCDKGTSFVILYGFILALIFILIVLIIIQLIIPLIKNKIFNYKYVKSYKLSPNELKKKCIFCRQDIFENEKVVTKCKHIIHKVCWDDNNHTCPEYGQNCNEGKQDFFDIKDPFSKKNKKSYLNWVMFGLIGGFLVWLLYLYDEKTMIFYNLSDGLVRLIHPTLKDKNIIQLFIDKINLNFSTGILMGFFLSVLFIYAEEYRRLSFGVAGRIILRGLMGALIGFITFLFGAFLILLINIPETSALVDWIPWLLFGASFGYSLSVKTTIHWKHGLIGGIISILFAFIILFKLSLFDQDHNTLLSFMIYGAGLGLSIATVRSTAEQYYLKILNGSKAGTSIAIHKWLGVHGGLNQIYMGKSNINEIQINWEKESVIADKHAKIYINRNRNIPVVVSLEKGMTTLYDNRLEMMPGKEYELINGTSFKIGETIYQYVEK